MLCPRCNSEMKVVSTGDASTPGLNLRFRDWRCKRKDCRFLIRTEEHEDPARQKDARWYAQQLVAGRVPLPPLE